jgi:two-component system, LytTR family, response regulator
MKLTTLIVDDEPLAREGLRALLSKDSEVTAIREARNGREAVESVRKHKPDLVLLDVQMPEMDGFAVVEAIGADSMPSVIFVTAHDQYAIHAFEMNALDYLLKPVMEERFVRAMARAKDRIRLHSADANRQIIGLLDAIATPRKYLTRLALRSAARISFLDTDEVDWFRAAENYVEIHSGQMTHLLHVTMNALEESLDPERFVRVHRSVIVNMKQIQHLEPNAHGEYVITLRNGTRVQSGRTYADRLKALVQNPF